MGAAPRKSATPSLLKILSARHPSLHITLMKIFWGHLFGRFAKGGEVPSFPQLFGKNPILKEVGGIEVASVIELSEASGRVAASLFICQIYPPTIDTIVTGLAWGGTQVVGGTL